MGFDPWQVALPTEMLAVDLAQVSYEEGILVANPADIMIDCLNSGLEGLPNQLLC